MDRGAADEFRREIREGETLLWAGRPDRGAFARRKIAVSVAGATVATLLLSWICTDWSDIGLTLIRAFGVVLSLVFVLAVPVAWFQATRLFYGVSDQRAMILRHRAKGHRHRSGRHLESYGRNHLGALNVNFLRTGGGDVVLFEAKINSGEGDATERRGFFGLSNPLEAEKYVRQMLRPINPRARVEALPEWNRPIDPDVRALLRPDEIVHWSAAAGRGGVIRETLRRVLGNRRRLYVVTDTRLMDLAGMRLFKPRLIELVNVIEIERIDRFDSTADFRFHHVVMRELSMMKVEESWFFGIGSPRLVEEIINTVQGRRIVSTSRELMGTVERS